MRSITRKTNDQDNEAFAKELRAFAASRPFLPVFSQEILQDTVKLLHSLVSISDKVLEVNGYFLMVQHIQKAHYLAGALLENIRLAVGAEFIQKKFTDDTAFHQYVAEKFLFSSLLSPFSEEEYQSTDFSLSIDEDNHITLADNLIRPYLQDVHLHVCNPEGFILACAYLNVKMSKHGMYEYIDGEASTFKETKRRRHLINLNDEDELKKHAWRLTRPYSDRGNVGKKEIQTSFNHLRKLQHFHRLKEQVLIWLRQTKDSGTTYNVAEVTRHFEISYPDYQKILLMAEAEGLLPPAENDANYRNVYTLASRNHQKILDFAKKRNVTPQQALNQVVTQFFELLEVRRSALGTRKP